jgi:hypothetical protein
MKWRLKTSPLAILYPRFPSFSLSSRMKASFSIPRGNGRLVRGESVWDTLTLELLDWEVPATIYAEEKKGIHEMWKIFT